MRHWGYCTRGLLLAVVLGLGAGCSDDSQPADAGLDAADGAVEDIEGDLRPDLPAECLLRVATINGQDAASVTQLTEADDRDVERAGVQVDIVIAGEGLADGTLVSLSVTELVPDPAAEASGGEALFAGVSLLSEEVAILAYAEGCLQDTVTLGVQPPPACTFVAPANNAVLSDQDDSIPDNGTFDYDVVIDTQNAAGGQVTLTVGASTLPDPQAPGGDGTVTFSDTVLPIGSGILLQAEIAVGSVRRTCRSTITIDTDLPTCTFQGFSPAATATSLGKPGLGLAQDTDPATPGLQTTVLVETNVNQVTLLVDSIPVATVSAVGGAATFSDQLLAEGERRIQASCANTASGVTSQSTEAAVLVDSVAPNTVGDLLCSVATQQVAGETLMMHRAGDIVCRWNAVDDPASGSGVEAVQLRYRNGSDVSGANWDDASTLQGPAVVPFPAGTPQSATLEGLSLGQEVYVGLRLVDYVGNRSAIARPTVTPLLLDYLEAVRTFSMIDNLGARMATGDFDCNGYTDLAVGDPTQNGGAGLVAIYLSQLKAGLSVNPIKVLSGTEAAGGFGSRLAALPRINGDPCTDLAVYAAHGETNQGRVLVYLGRQPFPDRDDVSPNSGAGLFGADLIYELPAGAGAGELIAGALASAGDFNGDGASDLALSHVDTVGDTARVRVIYGDASLAPLAAGGAPLVQALPAAAGVEITGGTYSAGFGLSMAASGGRVDSDSYSDLLFGAKSAAVAGAVSGRAYLVRGGAHSGGVVQSLPLGDSRVIEIDGSGSPGAFGAALAFVGDINGDGQGEFAVSDPAAVYSAGAVYLFNLAATPASSADAVSTLANNVSGAANDKFGIALAAAGSFGEVGGADFTGDGLPDLLVGAESRGTSGQGAVYLFAGSSSISSPGAASATYTFVGPADALGFGTVLSLAEDINGDGYPDLIVGAPLAGAGAGAIHLYY